MSLGIKILERELNELERCLEKSIESYLSEDITIQVHNIHKANLEPKINELKTDIKKLKND